MTLITFPYYAANVVQSIFIHEEIAYARWGRCSRIWDGFSLSPWCSWALSPTSSPCDFKLQCIYMQCFFVPTLGDNCWQYSPLYVNNCLPKASKMIQRFCCCCWSLCFVLERDCFKTVNGKKTHAASARKTHQDERYCTSLSRKKNPGEYTYYFSNIVHSFAPGNFSVIHLKNRLQKITSGTSYHAKQLEELT